MKENKKYLNPNHPLYYAANYFFRAEGIIKAKLPNAIQTIQFFQRANDVMLAGMQEVLELLQTYTDTSKYTIKYLPDGTIINDREVVLELEGKYEYFGAYEGLIDSILARSTSVATNTYHCMKAAGTKQIIFMSDRSDHYSNQIRDGKAAILAGVVYHPTTATSQNHPELVFGSMPHALIQALEGDVVKATKYYQELYPEDTDLVALVDFNNDVVTDSLKVLKEFGTDLKGVRVDTSKAVMDKMFARTENEYGVSIRQIKKLRQELDKHGGKHVRIVVSSGFTPSIIAKFESENAPVDAYGVGEYIMEIKYHFSADAVRINGKNFAKVGRNYNFNPKLVEYKENDQ